MSEESTREIRQVLHAIFEDGQTCFILSTMGTNAPIRVAKNGNSYMVLVHIIIAEDTLKLLSEDGLRVSPVGKMTYQISIVL